VATGYADSHSVNALQKGIGRHDHIQTVVMVVVGITYRRHFRVVQVVCQTVVGQERIVAMTVDGHG
jgi:hypothetical protein